MRKYAWPVALLGAAIIIVLVVWDTRIARAPNAACPQDTELCPDGSSVGRTGPHCEFTACAGESASSTAGDSPVSSHGSGVRGSVSLGPACPVMREPPSPQCADKPYATAIIVYHAGSSSALIVGNSNEDGTFAFKLPPGSYTLAAVGGKVFPRCVETNVVVPANGYASTTISCDTGIR